MLKQITGSILVFFVGVVMTITVFGSISSSRQTNNLPDANSNASSIANSIAAGNTVTNPKTGLTTQQVAQHSTPSNCYLIINQKVYNISNYIGQHPGGTSNITSRCGQEVTGIFAAIHSNAAWDLLSKYYIANLVGASSATANPVVNPNTVPKTIRQRGFEDD